MRKPTAILAALGSLVSLAAATAHATPPGTNGRLVISAKIGQHSQLFTVEPTGTGLKQITHFTDGSDAVNANWSPDGTRIVFERDAPGGVSIDTINADGSGLKTLLRGKIGPTISTYNGAPSYSPNGKLIVFDRQTCFTKNCGGPKDHNELWIADSNGTGLRRVTPPLPNRGNHYEDQPQFSPNGKQIAYVLHLGRTATTSDKTAVFLVNTNGLGQKQVTSYSLGVEARIDWSPDGTQLLFTDRPTTTRSGVDLYTIHPDGSSLTQLTHTANANAMSWSPDGTQIAFLIGANNGITASLAVMNTDGTAVRQITHGLNVGAASWGTQK